MYTIEILQVNSMFLSIPQVYLWFTFFSSKQSHKCLKLLKVYIFILRVLDNDRYNSLLTILLLHAKFC